jgi:hypothetical protein
MELDDKTIEELEIIKMQVDIASIQVNNEKIQKETLRILNDIEVDKLEFKLKFKQWEKEDKLNQEKWEKEKLRIEQEMKFYPWTNAAITGFVVALVTIAINALPKMF